MWKEPVTEKDIRLELSFPFPLTHQQTITNAISAPHTTKTKYFRTTTLLVLRMLMQKREDEMKMSFGEKRSLNSISI